MSKQYTFTMTVSVSDINALHAAASAKARANGMDEEFTQATLGTKDQVDIEACVHELLDPGVSPNGMQIEHCWCDPARSV